MCRGRGAVAWYPVHCTSINNTNSLISGDNKGVAAQFMEEWAMQSSANSNGSVGGDFIAAFGQSNVGDTSPNILGAFCQDTGEAPDRLPLKISFPHLHGQNFQQSLSCKGLSSPGLLQRSLCILLEMPDIDVSTSDTSVLG